PPKSKTRRGRSGQLECVAFESGDDVMSKAIDPAVNDSLAPFGLDPRSPRASGFVTPNKHVTPGDERSATDGIEDTIRTANTDLQLRSGEHLTLPLTIAVEQRDAAYRQLQVEREAWHAQH